MFSEWCKLTWWYKEIGKLLQKQKFFNINEIKKNSFHKVVINDVHDFSCAVYIDGHHTLISLKLKGKNGLNLSMITFLYIYVYQYEMKYYCKKLFHMMFISCQISKFKRAITPKKEN